ncbi:MAG: Hsp20/alpha crystallin family protein [Candidatus Anammoxibacter sp.]
MAEQSNLEREKACARIRTISPLTNIIEKEKEVVLEAEMAGLTQEDIDLELNGDELTITGKQRANGVPEGFTALYSERSPLEYKRRFTLGPMINKEAIKAKYENGVLGLILPKTAETLPRKLMIN